MLLVPRCFLFFAILGSLGREAESLCLDGAIAESNRKNLSFNGVELPVGFYVLDWESGYLAAELARVLVEEVLGYNTAVTGYDGGTSTVVFALTGCYYNDAWELKCPLEPLANNHSHHVALEVWLTNDLYYNQFVAVTDSRLPRMYELGYSGFEGQYVMDATVSEAWHAEGLHLDYFGDYDVTWHDTSGYFSNYSDIPMEKLTPCNATTLSNTQQMGFVQTFTPDPEGFDSRGWGYCADDKWWLSPACRNDTSRCIPFVTAYGWFYPQIMMRAIAHNMPIALASWIDWGDYVSGPSNYKILTYSWAPAIHFLEVAPHRITFPPNDQAAVDEGDYRTQFADVPTYTVVGPNVNDASSRLVSLLGNILIRTRDVEGMLQEYWDSWYDLRGTVCKWLVENEKWWREWVPVETKCDNGEGIVDSTGAYQTNRSLGVSCSVCIPGYYSAGFWDSTGKTFACKQCQAGEAQPLYESSQCDACAEGYYQSATGQSACRRCPIGTFATGTGSAHCTSCPTGKTTQGFGYRSIDDCVCPSGTYENSAGSCIACGEGATCAGFGAEPEALVGYYLSEVSDDGLSIFTCSTNPERCPGGVVGTCTTGRTGYACAECHEGWSPTRDGQCEPCQAGDVAVAIVVFGLASLGLAGLYAYGSKEQKLQSSATSATIFLTFAQVVMVLQMVGVLTRVTMDWPEPMKSFQYYISMLTFNVDTLVRLGCVMDLTTLARYVMKLAIVPVVGSLLVIIHFVVCFIRSPGQWNPRWFALVSSIGVLVSAFYISMSLLILSPFQCLIHPNDVWTMIQYQAVVCWDSTEHATMLAISVVAAFIPIGFLVGVFLVLYKFDSRMASGDVEYLKKFGWLLVRVKPESRWFALFTLARNLLIALVPAIPVAFWQTFVLEVLFVISFAATLIMNPGKSDAANAMDTMVNATILCVLFLSAPFLPDEAGTKVPEVTFALLLALFLAFPIFLILYLGRQLARGQQKQYAWFLCHQKAAAGAFARLLKISLTNEAQRQGGSVFLDSDDLIDLSKLFAYVRNDVKTLVVLASREIFRSFWCLGEVTTATLQNVDMAPVHFSDFTLPDQKSIDDVNGIPGFEKLIEQGFLITDIKKALSNFEKWTCIMMPAQLNEPQLTQITTWVAKRGSASFGKCRSTIGSLSSGVSESAHDRSNYILADLDNTEAVSAGLILSRLVAPLLSADPRAIPKLMGPVGARHFQKPDKNSKQMVLILLCTTGCFSSADFVFGLFEIVVKKVQNILPVVAADAFQFPSPAFYTHMERTVKLMGDNEGLSLDPKVLHPLIRAIFQKISPRLSVMASAAVLMVQSKLILRTLETEANVALGDLPALTPQMEGHLNFVIDQASEKMTLGRRLSSRVELGPMLEAIKTEAINAPQDPESSDDDGVHMEEI